MSPNKPHMWERPVKPLVAAVNGAAAAGGWSIAQMCDVRLAADNARLGITETKWSLMPPFAVELTKMIGISNVLELVMTADLLPAERVKEMGFLNKVVPADELVPEAVKMAESIAQNAPLAVRTIKDLAYSSLDMSIAEISAKTYVAYDYILTTQDSKEGPRPSPRNAGLTGSSNSRLEPVDIFRHSGESRNPESTQQGQCPCCNSFPGFLLSQERRYDFQNINTT